MGSRRKALAKKIAATSGVVAIFIYFWVNGPLQDLVPTNLASIVETPYAKVKLVGNEVISASHGTIASTSAQGHGWQLIRAKKNAAATSSGLISSRQENIQGNHQLSQQLSLHCETFFDASDISIIQSPHGAIAVFNKEGNTYAYTESLHLTPHIYGYGGPINMGILFDVNGQISEVRHVHSTETQSYLRTIAQKGYYTQFPHLNMDQKNTIDAVSGATISTKAMAHIISETVAKTTPMLTENTLASDDLVLFGVKAQNTWYWIIHSIVILVIFTYGFQKKYKKTKKHMTILSLCSVLYIGFFLNNSFTYTTFLHPFLGTAISSFMGVYCFLSLLGAIWGKNVYCKYVCPFGHAQRLSLKVSKNKFTAAFFISNKWVAHFRNGLAILLITGVLLGLRNWGNFELFPDLFGLEYTSLWAIISFAIILINLRYPLLWCRLACPTGAVLDGIAKGCK